MWRMHDGALHVIDEDLDRENDVAWVAEGIRKLERWLARWAEFQARYPESAT
jgi:hypothetical protein